MKKCKNSSNCQWGNAMQHGFCAYDDNMSEQDICPRLVDAWDAAPDDMAVTRQLIKEFKDEK